MVQSTNHIRLLITQTTLSVVRISISCFALAIRLPCFPHAKIITSIARSIYNSVDHIDADAPTTTFIMKSFNAIVLIHLLALASVRNFNLTDIKAASDNNRIVNGLDAAIGQFPHQVSLRAKQNNRHFCGGTILSSRWIVTAAHCSFLNMDVVAVAGSIELNRGGRAYDIASIVPHPRYVPGSFPYDIALWQTSEDIAFGEAVQPAILPSYDTPADAALIVSGWGRTRVCIF